MQRLVEAFRERLPALTEEAADRIIAARMPTYLPLPRERVVSMVVAPGYQRVLTDMTNKTTSAIADLYSQIGLLRAQQGGNIEDILAAMTIAIELLNEQIKRDFAADTANLAEWFEHMVHVFSSATSAVSRSFVAGREEIIQAQASQLREISTPIIPIHAGVIVLPLVGSIDSRRAGQIMEALLDGINTFGADAVIVDITGVPVVDTGVANYLLRAARAVRLLGSRMILVGISPEIAQTIVQLGVELTDIVTRANLQSGVEYALKLRGVGIVDLATGAHAQ